MITTIITGAGAVLDWGAPTTTTLTEKLKTDITFKTKSKITVGQYIYNKIEEKNFGTIGFDKSQINFEHIINLIESIYNYIKSDTEKNHLESTVYTEMKDEIETELFSFQYIYKKHGNGYYYPIKGNNEICFDNRKTYLRFIYNHFIEIIVNEIEKYESKENIEKYKKINNKFNKFIQTLGKSTIRYYTTNYDRLPILISDFSPFEGFSKSNESHLKGKYVFEALEIGSNRKDNCYYNLHGSIHHNHEGGRITNEIDKTFAIPNDYNIQLNQSDEELLRSSIITGMNKSSRILFSPHLSFYNSFNIDCLHTDLLVIIGYSFSDVHLNQAIKNAIISRAAEGNKELRVLVIDYWEDDTMDYKLWHKMSSLKLVYSTVLSPKSLIKAKSNPHYIYGDGLKSFLKSDEFDEIFK